MASAIKHYSYHMNGGLEDERIASTSIPIENNQTVPSIQIDRDGEALPAVNDRAAVSGGNSEDHSLKPATFGLTRNGYIGHSDSDDNADDDQGKLDDIYNFELSEDQKQAVRELFNLKIDLGFAADDDNRSGMYDLSDRVQQLNEELAKEPPLPDTRPSELKVKFKDNVVDFISPTPEPELDSEEDGPMPENAPQQTEVKKQAQNPLPAPTSVKSDATNVVAESIIKAAESIVKAALQSPAVTAEISASQSTMSGQHSDATAKVGTTPGGKKSGNQTDAELIMESQVADDSCKKPAAESGEVCGSVSPQIADYRGVPMRPQSASDTVLRRSMEADDLALIECSGKYRMMSVTELAALQRRSGSSLSPGRSVPSLSPGRSTSCRFASNLSPCRSALSPRPPLTSSYSRSTSLPLTPPRCQSARTRSSDHIAAERQAMEEERRLRREEAEAGFQIWLSHKKREAAEKRRREQEERQKNQPTEEDDPERTQRAFEAWLRQKTMQRRAERRLHKSETYTETEEDAETSRVSFQQWLRCKAKQQRSERRLRRAEQVYLSEGVVVHRPQDCQRAFNRWVRAKNRDLRHEQEMERHRAAISALAARKSKKSQSLAHAMTHARALRCSDDSGRRYY